MGRSSWKEGVQDIQGLFERDQEIYVEKQTQLETEIQAQKTNK